MDSLSHGIRGKPSAVTPLKSAIFTNKSQVGKGHVSGLCPQRGWDSGGLVVVPIAYPESRLLEFVKNPTTWPSILKSRKKSVKKSRKSSKKNRGKN